MTKKNKLEIFYGYLLHHRGKVETDLIGEESARNKIIKLVNEARLNEIDHLVDVVEDIMHDRKPGSRS